MELIFTPIGVSFANDATLMSSGFHIAQASSLAATMDLVVALEMGPASNKASNGDFNNSGRMKSVMMMTFELASESHMQPT